MKKDKKLLFVYGTLKKGQRLSGLMSRQKRLGEATTVDSNFTIKDFLRSHPITFRHYDKRTCKYKIKGELYEIKDLASYQAVHNMECAAGYTMVNTIVKLNDGDEYVSEIFIVEDTPSKVIDSNVLSDRHVTTIKGVKEWNAT